MKVKPWVMTGAGTLFACAALAVVMAASGPRDASREHLVVFWVALGFAVWGLLATLLLWCRTNLAQAVWCALVLTAGAAGVFALRRWGSADPRLLAGLGLATLSLSFFIWYRLRHG